MKCPAAKRRIRRRRLPEVDEGQIIEALRLRPEERIEKHRVFVEFVEEMERAGRLRTAHSQS
jgi:hypothetical protein